MLQTRVATAVVGVPLIIVLVLAGGGWYTAVVALVLAIATLEFQTPHFGSLHPLALLAAALAAAMAGGALVGPEWVLWFAVGAVLLPLLFATLTGGEPMLRAEEWLWATGGALYIGFLGAHLVLLREFDNGRDWVFLAVLATFATDTMSYFVGRAIGQHHFAPRISPGKTVEGAVGGFVAGAVAVLLLNFGLGLRMSAALVLPLALLLPLAAQVGDLAESIIKRAMGVKDAGRLVPGHGGFMDRLDSVLLTGVVVYYYALWVAP